MNVSELIKSGYINEEYRFFREKLGEIGIGQYSRVALVLAEIKGAIVKRRTPPAWQNFWQSIPTVSADAQVGDVVKDYSINSDGQAGVVFEVRDMRKRNGSIVTLIEFGFYGHTNLQDLRFRKIELKKS